tara:strand:- start:450 stop:773 length:324 start_codon:yes stop_codon:yes gene_type:complete
LKDLCVRGQIKIAWYIQGHPAHVYTASLAHDFSLAGKNDSLFAIFPACAIVRFSTGKRTVLKPSVTCHIPRPLSEWDVPTGTAAVAARFVSAPVPGATGGSWEANRA